MGSGSPGGPTSSLQRPASVTGVEPRVVVLLKLDVQALPTSSTGTVDSVSNADFGVLLELICFEPVGSTRTEISTFE